MNKINFENSRLFFQDFFIGTLCGDIEFHGNFEQALVEKMSSKYYAQVHSADLVLHFSIKEKSPEFNKITDSETAVTPHLKHLLSDFGTLVIKNENGSSIKIEEAFWTRFPFPEFQIKHNPQNTIHSLYFLWRK